MSTSVKLSFKQWLATLPWVSWVLLIGGGIFALGPLSVTWSNNPNYSFGWLMPLVALFLFSERWPTRPERMASTFRMPPLPVLIFVGALFFFLRLVAEADPDWRPGLWLMVSLYLGALLSWLWIYGGHPWTKHFAFPVGFLLFALPWLFAIELPLVQNLMRLNTVLVAGSLQQIDISAVSAGNIIHLPNCDLGIEEACSGILSLQSSLMMGCLLGEIYLLTVGRRFLLVFASLGFALIGNYIRTLFLALVAATDGAQAVTAWHDTAGFAILAFTAISAWLCSLFLRTPPLTKKTSFSAQSRTDTFPGQTRRAQWLAIGVFGIALLAEIGTQAWFGWRESKVPRHPEWSINFPASDAFKEVPVSEVTRDVLKCDFVKAVTWQDAQSWQWTTFWFGYKPKAYNKVAMGWHNPDKCLPSVGMIQDQDYPTFLASIHGIDLNVQPRRFLTKETAVYVFWVVYPVSGSLPPVIDDQAKLSFAAKIRFHFHDLWEGNRGIGIETLEVALAGPSSYEAAKSAYLAMLQSHLAPSSSVGILPSKK